MTAAWSCNDVVQWVEKEGLGHLAPVLKKNGVDGQTLLELEKADLREELGIEGLKDRKELWALVEGLQAGGKSPAPAKPVTMVPPKVVQFSDPKQVSPRSTPQPRTSAPRPTVNEPSGGVYRSEYALRYGNPAAPMIPNAAPRTTAISFRATAATSKRCHFCNKGFAPGASYTELTLPGEKAPAVLHDTPECHDGWVKANARPCDHCGELMSSTIVTVSLPGNKKRADLHEGCKTAWLEANADPCDHCGKPMTKDVVTLTGSFGTAKLHEACCNAFEAKLRGKKVAPVPVVVSNPKGTGRCASCMKSFKPGDAPILLKLPNSRQSVELHPACKNAYARSNSSKCDHCGLPMVKSMVTVTGNFGSAQLHQECADNYEHRLRRNGYRKPISMTA